MTSKSCSADIAERFDNIKRAYEMLKNTSVDNDVIFDLALSALEKQEPRLRKIEKSFAADSSAKMEAA